MYNINKSQFCYLFDEIDKDTIDKIREETTAELFLVSKRKILTDITNVKYSEIICKSILGI